MTILNLIVNLLAKYVMHQNRSTYQGFKSLKMIRRIFGDSLLKQAIDLAQTRVVSVDEMVTQHCLAVIHS